MSGRKCGCERSSGGVCAEYISTAASSPAWFTRRAESRKSRWDCVSGLAGRAGSAVAWSTDGELCEGSATAADREEAEGWAVLAGVLWMRAFWRAADGTVQGARASQVDGCRRRAAARANERVGNRAADMLSAARVARRKGAIGRLLYLIMVPGGGGAAQ
jgi:hypothetical protein